MIDNENPLVLISGLAAGEKIFLRQVEAFKNVLTVPWLDVAPKETLDEYAERLAKMIASRIGRGTPCYVAGLSLGGMLAPMVASHLNVKACILIASIRKPSEFPNRHRLFYHLCRYLTPVTTTAHFFLKNVLFFLMPFIRRYRSPERVVILEQVRDCKSRLFARQLRMLFTWALDPSSWRSDHERDIRERYDFPVYHIHGGKDRVLPASRTTPDQIIPDGRHVLPLYCAEEVNRFIADVMGINTENVLFDVASATQETGADGVNQCK